MNQQLERITDAMETFLEQRGLHVDLANVRFVREQDIAYSPPSSWSVTQAKVIDAAQFDKLNPLFEGGPSWIHGNLMLSREYPPLISLATGAPVGNPNPSINVSMQEVDLAVED